MTTKRSVRTADETPIHISKEKESTEDITEDQYSESDISPEDEDQPDEKKSEIDTIGKDLVNIAVVLPYNTHKVPLDFVSYELDTNIYISPENSEALDFYMGLKFAVDDFKNYGKKINVFVLDDGKSDYQTQKVLSERPFPQVDIIVSGSSDWISKSITDYSLSQQIPIYSPFKKESPSANELFYAALPNDNHLTEQLIVKTQALYPESGIEIIQDKHDPASVRKSDKIRLFIEREMGIQTNVIKNTEDKVNEHDEPVSFYQPTSTQIVIIASDRHSFIKKTLESIENAPIQPRIIGMPSWVEFRNLESSTQPNPNIHIAGIMKNKNTAAFQNFSERFKRTYHMEDNENVCLGYDLIQYIMTGLDQNILSKNPTSNQLNISTLCYNFDFIPVTDNKGILYFINSQVDFLKYSGGKFRSVKL